MSASAFAVSAASRTLRPMACVVLVGVVDDHTLAARVIPAIENGDQLHAGALGGVRRAHGRGEALVRREPDSDVEC